MSLTPEEILEAAERVRRTVDPPLPDITEILRKAREGDCNGFRPPIGGGILRCPNAPGACFCTGACMGRDSGQACYGNIR